MQGIESRVTKPSRPPRPCNLCGHRAAKVLITKNGYDVVRCLSCGLVFVANPPSTSELAKLYSSSSNYHARFEDSSGDFRRDCVVARKHLELLEKYMQKGRLLDVGCAAAFFLKEAEADAWEACGIEISSMTANIARTRHGLDVRTGVLEEDTFPPDWFDAVTLWDVLEHMVDPKHTMSIVNSILKVRGIVVISTPNIGGLFPRLSYKVARIANYWPHVAPPGHLFQFSARTLHRLLRETGFEILRTYYQRIPLECSFDTFLNWRRFLYSLAFIPVALVGPLLRSGDSMIVVAKRVSAGEPAGKSRDIG